MLIEGNDDIQAIILSPEDNTATALTDLEAGSEVRAKCGDKYIPIVLQESIKLGHKFAIRDIAQKEPVIKYGNQIGKALADISVGYWVHVHNVESLRGRGDLATSKKRGC
ncbi:MAG: UxaA family hydrolase [bacterium]|jgi:altronate dehydratase small subunit